MKDFLSIMDCPVELLKELLHSQFIQKLKTMSQIAASMGPLARTPQPNAIKTLSLLADQLETNLNTLLHTSKEHTWARPVISHLEWRLRLLTSLVPELLFHEYCRAYLFAISVLTKTYTLTNSLIRSLGQSKCR